MQPSTDERPLQRHERFRVRVDHIGRSRSPVIVIDDFLDDPAQVVAWAASRTDYAARTRFYPGVSAPAPARYVRTLRAHLEEIVRDTFGWKGEIEVPASKFSLVLTPPEKLLPVQRVPHVDVPDTNGLAVLHYLCSPRHGGTAFYRHRSTGYEVILAGQVDHYLRTIEEEVRVLGTPPPRYINGDTPLFEQIARYDSVFNRVLIYSTAILHCAAIPADFVPDPNPRTGRLTVNSFFRQRVA